MTDADLVTRVVQSTGLSPDQASRVISEIVDFYREPTDQYVRRRHARLQARGMRNDDIFATIQGELACRVVAPPPLSERQLRRLVYG